MYVRLYVYVFMWLTSDSFMSSVRCYHIVTWYVMFICYSISHGIISYKLSYFTMLWYVVCINIHILHKRLVFFKPKQFTAEMHGSWTLVRLHGCPSPFSALGNSFGPQERDFVLCILQSMAFQF